MTDFWTTTASADAASFFRRAYAAAASATTDARVVMFDEYNVGPLEKLDWQVERVCRLAR